jgi:hypothetical protein
MRFQVAVIADQKMDHPHIWGFLSLWLWLVPFLKLKKVVYPTLWKSFSPNVRMIHSSLKKRADGHVIIVFWPV